jgi:formylglycine-generating enzyme required for sulfatase activity
MMPLAVPHGQSVAATEMVQIPAGAFSMRSEDGPQDERPQHIVQLAAYWIDRTPVTNAQFAQFLNAIGSQGERYYDIDDNDSRVHRRDGKWSADSGSENHPVDGFPKGASPYGVLDMAGNGWEWISSAYLPYPYDAKEGREDLTREQVRGTRGGGHDSRPEELTTTHRGRQVSRNPRGGHHNIGFRCAR